MTLDNDAVREIDQLVNETLAREQVPGGAVAVARNGEIVWARGFGARNLETGEPVTPDTIFGIGSIGKSFTALGIAQLADQGRLRLDDLVIDHIPELRLPDQTMAERMTIEQLLSHTAGLPVLPIATMALGAAKGAGPMTEFRHVLDYLATMPERPAGEPGERFSYSDESYYLAGEIIQRASGKSYADYMHERVFAPIGMTRSTMADPVAAGIDDVTDLYDFEVNRDATERTPVYRPHWPDSMLDQPAGLHRSTARDMARYLIAHMDGIPGLSRSMLDELHRPRSRRDRGTRYALGWGVNPDYKGVAVWSHGGGVTGVSSYVICTPERRAGVVVLLNISEGPSSEIAFDVLDCVLGLPPGEQAMAYDPDDVELERVVGEFAFDARNIARSIVIRREGDEVSMSIDGGPARPLRAIGPNAFEATDGWRRLPIDVPDGTGPAPLLTVFGRVCWRVR